MDRYLKLKQEKVPLIDLHLIGVTCMFIASKYEDIIPLKMRVVYEKIAHKKLSVERIRNMEMDIMKTINYKISAPTTLDFLKIYLREILGINHTQRASFSDKKQLDKNGLTTE